MNSTLTIKTRLVNTVALGLVLALSLSLLIFIGFGEAKRTYPKFEIDKLAAQGQLIQDTINPFLLADLPINQLPGFSILTQPLLDSDSSLYALYLTNAAGDVQFVNVQPGQALLDFTDVEALTEFRNIPNNATHYRVSENKFLYQVSFTLENRLQTVGDLHILMPKAVVSNKIKPYFEEVIIIGVVVWVLYLLFLFFTTSRWMGQRENHTLGWSKSAPRFLGLSYGVAFLLVTIVLIVTLTNIYLGGIRAKEEALANSLVQRLNVAFESGLTIDDFSDLDQTLAEYQTLDPEISVMALVIDDIIKVHPDRTLIDTPWIELDDHIGHDIIFYDATLADESHLHLHTRTPKSAVYQRLWRSVKNFFVLFIASGILAQLFFQFIRALSNRPNLVPGMMHTQRGYLLSLIGPLYFTGIFVTHGFTTSFLPQHFKEIAEAANIQSDISSLFSLYYTTYALALLFTSRLSEKIGIKPLLLGSTALITLNLMLLSVTHNFYLLFVIQALSGFAEGTFFIAIQTYILTIATQKQRTRGASIIVNALYGGLLSGAAIGALLAGNPTFGTTGVFILASLIALMAFFSVIIFIPRINALEFSEDEEPNKEKEVMPSKSLSKPASPAPQKGSPFDRYWLALKDVEFIKTAFLIGVPVKVILAGIFKASLPLILANLDYPTEDIGQIIILYFGGVLLSSAVISRLADKIGRMRLILFLGTIGSGLGLILIGSIDSNLLLQYNSANITNAVLIGGMLMLGLAHGFIQAPIITHISNTDAAHHLGKSSATSIYRLFERVGNIGGPLLVGYLLVLSDYQAITVSWVGIGVIICGILFIVKNPKLALTPSPSPNISSSKMTSSSKMDRRGESTQN